MEVECACPYCGESMALWIDADGGQSQNYVEDCAVCCRPIQVHVSIDSEGEPFAAVQRGDE
jgi:hypothetical protein